MSLRGAEFFQERAPAWARTLAASVELPTGVVTGSKARVYETLRLAKEKGTSFQVGRRAAPAGWVPTWVLREPWCGGAAGDRRLRDLREAGVALESQTFDGGDEASSSTWLWRLGDASLPAGSRVIHQVKAGPLGSLRFTTFHGRPVLWAGTLIDVTPGSSSWAAPSGDIQLRFTRREIDADVAGEAYRQELLQRWKQGKLQAELQPHAEISFFHRADEGCFDPLPCLVYALTRLGALHLNPVPEVR